MKQSCMHTLMHMADDADFTAVMENLTIPGGSQRVCVEIPITDDNTVEHDDSFHIELSTFDASVVLNVTMAEVVIINDDGEFHCVS